MITKIIQDLASKIKALTVAEFVSDERIYNAVKELGIDFSQGYYIMEPSESIIKGEKK
ncbi:MAG: EAL domain-containing protein [Leptospiraceae bacterium]|nr:EAL domain-containing protein [Leptospiraceae bacterium]